MAAAGVVAAGMAVAGVDRRSRIDLTAGVTALALGTAMERVALDTAGDMPRVWDTATALVTAIAPELGMATGLATAIARVLGTASEATDIVPAMDMAGVTARVTVMVAATVIRRLTIPVPMPRQLSAAIMAHPTVPTPARPTAQCTARTAMGSRTQAPAAVAIDRYWLADRCKG